MFEFLNTDGEYLFRSRFFTLTLGIPFGELLRYLPVDLVCLVDDGVCEVFTSESDLGGILFASTVAFAKILEMGHHLLRDGRFQLITAIPFKAKPIQEYPEGLHSADECESCVDMRVILIFSSLMHEEVGTCLIDVLCLDDGEQLLREASTGGVGEPEADMSLEFLVDNSF